MNEPPRVEPSATSRTAAAGHAAGHRGHVVVYVDDNSSNIGLMEDMLSELGAVQLVPALSARLGLDLVGAWHPDLIIVDVDVAGGSSPLALSHLRAWSAAHGIPVITLTAATQARDATNTGAREPHLCFTKPIDVGELISAVGAQLALADATAAMNPSA